VGSNAGFPDVPPVPIEPHRPRYLFRAPPAPIALACIVALSAVTALFAFGLAMPRFLEGWLLLFLIPGLVAVGATGPLASVLGGRFEFQRSTFLVFTTYVLLAPVAGVWRLGLYLEPGSTPDVAFLLAFLIGPMVWFRHLSLYGISRPSHLRSLPPTLLQPVVYALLLPVLVSVSLAWALALVLCGLIGFGCSVALLRAADRPLRREFRSSGVRLIRPLLDHVRDRDPQATSVLEGFFLQFAQPANLRVSLLSFWRDGHAHATVALPTVHPGPFAALGASDLPRKLSVELGTAAGTVLTPHTPCDHDLDLPSEAQVQQVGAGARTLLGSLTVVESPQSSRVVRPDPASFAQAQLLGGVALVVASQAPAPTDDIAFSVAERITREVAAEGGPPVALVDGHNSYIEGQGDITYGTPAAEKLIADCKAAVRAAVAAAVPGPIEVGVGVRDGYDTGRDGIGPQGIRALVVRAAGATSAYVLFDANNLVVGRRAPIVRALEGLVDAAEVMTTDNHIVHEVDGGINALGERLPTDALIRGASDAVRAALADLGPAEVRFGTRELPAVRTLGPGFTARLLTSLGDTLTMFQNMAVATFLLMLTGSLVVVFAFH
jgi:putative membrane protein